MNLEEWDFTGWKLSNGSCRTVLYLYTNPSRKNLFDNRAQYPIWGESGTVLAWKRLSSPPGMTTEEMEFLLQLELGALESFPIKKEEEQGAPTLPQQPSSFLTLYLLPKAHLQTGKSSYTDREGSESISYYRQNRVNGQSKTYKGRERKKNKRKRRIPSPIRHQPLSYYTEKLPEK